MGLDMYAYAVSKRDAIGELEIAEGAEREELQYWRKHHDLHGWMEKLYRDKGGDADSFNCIPVELTVDDLDNLQQALLEDNLPRTSGFFFGDNPPDLETMREDLMFVQKCRIAIKEGKVVYYDSWW
jgi:hypothetical protein